MTGSLFYIIIGLASLNALLLLWVIYLEWRLYKVFRGKKAKDLENVFVDFGQAVDRLINKAAETDQTLAQIGKRLMQDISKCHTTRFNPFKEQGGNQSFSTCLINDEGDGVVISSLYSRDKVSVYAKPLNHFRSDYELTAEEIETITEARKKVE